VPDKALNGRRRARIIVVGSLIGIALGFAFALLVYGMPRWREALVSTLWVAPIPVLALLFYTRTKRR
jgi:hypothetical protein